MKTLRFLAFAALLLAPLAIATAAETPRPNLVMIIADDHGVDFSQPYGAKEIHTPNMQAMAREGMRFTRAYVASPSCAPSRAALFTGLEPYNNGIVGNHEKALKPGVVSLLPLLAKQGYEIVWCGKVGHTGNVPYRNRSVVMIPATTQPLDLSGVEKYLAARPDKSKPLALFLGDTTTHTPWPAADQARIAPQEVVIPPRLYDTPEARHELTRYVEAVEKLDAVVGQARALVAAHLDPKNTLVISTSDHGGAWPFGKWSLYETGIRTPLLAVWPGKIKPGSTAKAMVSWIDILPTFIDLAGGTVPPGLDGRSFKGVLLGKTDTHHDHLFATHKGDQAMYVYPCRSVRTEEWKYILNLHPEFLYTGYIDAALPTSVHYFTAWPSWVAAAQSDPAAAAFLRAYHTRPAEELYRVEEDPYEVRNLANDPAHREVLEKMRAMVRNRMKEVGDDESLSGKPHLLQDFSLPSGGKLELQPTVHAAGSQ